MRETRGDKIVSAIITTCLIALIACLPAVIIIAIIVGLTE
jgi:hypothetical protein